MGFSEDQILVWFSQYAYQPLTVYFTVVLFMLASSFGLPIPEEVTLISTGIVAYMGSRPDLYPPPYDGAAVVGVKTAAAICFLAVFLSDFLVFSLGRYLGNRLIKTRFLQKNRETFDKVSRWVQRYGMWAAGIFRFTPGFRFPGHFSCGMLGLKPRQFVAVDGLAALVSVPTQVILIASFGDKILGNLKEAKLVLFAIIAVLVGIFFLRRYWDKRKTVA